MVNYASHRLNDLPLDFNTINTKPPPPPKKIRVSNNVEKVASYFGLALQSSPKGKKNV